LKRHVISWSFLVVAALIIPASSVLCPTCLSEAPAVWLEALSPSPPGAIIVQQPDIYTRERLVNDRFSQEYWLTQQLRATEKLAEDGWFEAVQSKRGSSTTNTATGGLTLIYQPGADGSATPPQAPPASPDAGDSPQRQQAPPGEAGTIAPNLRTSPIDHFRDMVAYREDVRQELMQTQLDDRHDLAGNTLFRFDFDATVVPTSSISAVAVIVGRVSKPASGSHLSARRAYREWKKLLQRQYNGVLKHLELALLSGGTPDHPDAIDEFEKFRLFLTMENTLAIAKLTNTFFDVKRCLDSDERLSLKALDRDPGAGGASCGASRVHGQLVRSFLLSRRLSRQQNFARDLAGAMPKDTPRAALLDKADYVLPDPSPTSRRLDSSEFLASLQQWYNSAALSCQKITHDFAARGLIPDINTTRIALHADSNGSPIFSAPIQCPPVEAPLQDQIDALVYVYSAVARYAIDARQARPATQPPADGTASLTFRECLSSAAATFLAMTDAELSNKDNSSRERLFKRHFYLRNGTFNPTRTSLCRDTDRTAILYELATDTAVSPSQVNLAASAYVAHRINEAGTGDAGERLSKYFHARVVGCELGACQIELQDRNSSPSRPDVREQGDGSQRLQDDLGAREKGRVFVYSVTPKQLAERSSDYTAINRLSQLLASAGLSQVGAPADLAAAFQFVRETRDHEETLRRHPLVVGFGSSRQDKDEAVFGWLLSPSAGGGHIPIERTLTATLSLPSWWRSAAIEIDTCWLLPNSRPAQQIRTAEDLIRFCSTQGGNDRGRGTADAVDLPGSVAEITRALGIEVRQEPYLSGNLQQSVEIGRPARIVLEGGRLWRGTVVVLGNYLKADRIEVTPDMQGIIATFECVTPPPDFPSEAALVELTALEPATCPQRATRGGLKLQPFNATTNLCRPRVTPGLTKVTIWTSEGHTTAAMVKLTPFRTFEVHDQTGKKQMAEGPCWFKNRDAPIRPAGDAELAASGGN
jgi:hypothetical protein